LVSRPGYISSDYHRLSKKKLTKLDVTISDLSYSEVIKSTLESHLHITIDPLQKYYLKKDHDMGIKVAAIAPEFEDVDLHKRGLLYDPILESFVVGAGGHISSLDCEKNTSAPLVIRGLSSASQRALQLCASTDRDFYTIDTGYFQPSITKAKMYHRVTKGDLQNLGPIVNRKHDRLENLVWKYRKPTPGTKILVCPPSDKVMKFYNKDLNKWIKETVANIELYTDRPVEIRLKPSRFDRVTSNTIWSALDDVHCLVTFNSIAATEALLYSVPAITLAPNAASVLCHTQIQDIDQIQIPSKDVTTQFAAHLSYCQFTIPEFRNGYAWKILNESS
jgi:hypothetical protein